MFKMKRLDSELRGIVRNFLVILKKSNKPVAGLEPGTSCIGQILWNNTQIARSFVPQNSFFIK